MTLFKLLELPLIPLYLGHLADEEGHILIIVMEEQVLLIVIVITTRYKGRSGRSERSWEEHICVASNCGHIDINAISSLSLA